MLGNTVWAGALVLAAFMLGIALGALAAARWAPRLRRAALAYAGAELAVALTGSLLVWGLPAAEPLLGAWLSPLAGQAGLLGAARLAFALAALLVPTFAMGLTLPLGVRMLADRETTRALGLPYAANTFGACIAPLAAEHYLIEALGLRGTALAAAALNIAAAAMALASRTGETPPAAPAALAQSPAPARLLAAAALTGALALALEVVWFRLLLLYAPATDASFALMLTLLLAGIALGGAAAPLAARVAPAWVAAACGIAVVAGYALAAPATQAGLPQLVDYAAPLMLPAAVCSGLLFTLLGAALRGMAGDPQPAIGRLACANTLGGALGAALGGFVLLPGLGIEASLFLLAAGYGAAALLLLAPSPARSRFAPAVIAVIALALFPFGRQQGHLAQAARLYLRDGSSVAGVTQGATMTLQVLRRERFGEAAEWRLLTDSYSMSGVDRDSTRYMQTFAWLPLALHPRPRRALLISYGAGNTAEALLSDPQLASLTVVDISPEILKASGLIHGLADPLLDGRVRVVLEDGRHFLATRREQFDIITGEPPPPMMAGVVNLYSSEYFAALARRLAPGGLATYWLPTHQFEPRGARAVVAAWCAAFPDCSLWAGSKFHWILLGGREYAARPSVDHFARLWRVRPSAPLIAANGYEHPAQLGATFLADAAQLREWIGDTAPLVDDFPKRIAAPPPADPPLDEYARWLVPEGARRRFAASPWIAAHWPAELLRDSEAFFRVQPILNGQIAPHPVKNLVLVDRLLRGTELQLPVYWLMGSDLVEQSILEREPERPDQAYARGVRALAERDYVAAARYFKRAASDDPGELAPLAAYAACRAERRSSCL